MENDNKNEDNEIFIIDAHCHFQYFSSDELVTIVKEGIEKGFKHFLSNSTGIEDFNQTKTLTESINSNFYSDCIFSGYGHHPWYLENLEENWFENLKKLCENEKETKYFIGEIGIDGGKPKK
jgi:Tat protein secretion system quality control protein TatD with DNase activity